ncbi:SDR family NAD(P)-dependent oxidoreductase [Actinosynnema sp. NPDC047251]|uniref:SDR family NAD(P)-dependent oxidoreductase n=1 Tax=Saccharothrix espanaensis TaxID=103731 RepID=UPI002F909693
MTGWSPDGLSSVKAAGGWRLGHIGTRTQTFGSPMRSGTLGGRGRFARASKIAPVVSSAGAAHPWSVVVRPVPRSAGTWVGRNRSLHSRSRRAGHPGVVVVEAPVEKAVVTGGTHGMGLVIVRELLARGAEVVLTGRNERNIEEARTTLKGEAPHVVRSDAASMADIAALGALVTERLGSVDYLFVNHGIAQFAELAEVTEEAWDRHFAVNTKGAFFTVQRLAPLLNDGGAVVFTTVAHSAPRTCRSCCAASKLPRGTCRSLGSSPSVRTPGSFCPWRKCPQRDRRWRPCRHVGWNQAPWQTWLRPRRADRPATQVQRIQHLHRDEGRLDEVAASPARTTAAVCGSALATGAPPARIHSCAACPQLVYI